jgi:hypothetical protein
MWINNRTTLSRNRVMASKKKKPKERNPVAKNMNKFNKPATHKDKKNDYKRHSKHKKADKQSAFFVASNS